MENPRNDVCGCCGPGKPAYELRHMIELLERQEEERKQREEQQKKNGGGA